MHVCKSDFCMRSGWALAADSELQAPGSLRKLRGAGRETCKSMLERWEPGLGIPLLWGSAVGAGPTAGRRGGVCREGCSGTRSWGYVRGEPA